MTVVPGNTFVRILPGRRRMKYVVRAVRRAPFSYAEVEPVDGGARAPVPLHLVEQWVAHQELVNQPVSVPSGSVRRGVRRYGRKGRAVPGRPSGDARRLPRR